MPRKRFKSSRICSSENYEDSRKVHFNDLQRNHDSHIDTLMMIQLSIKVEIRRIPYVMAFGTMIPLSKEEVTKIEASLVVWK